MVPNPNFPITDGNLCNLTRPAVPLGRLGQRIRHGFYRSFPAGDPIQAGLATTRGCHDLIIDSGELYKSLSQLPAFGPWMIFCCNAMRVETGLGDSLIFDASETLLIVNDKLHVPKANRPIICNPNLR
jgi:hypothetical protein